MCIKDLKEFDNFIERKSSSNNLYLIGAGSIGRIIGQYLNEKEVKWIGYVDKKKQGSTLNGKRVFGYGDIKGKSALCLVTATMSFFSSIFHDLKSAGIDEEQVIYVSGAKIFNDIMNMSDDFLSYIYRVKELKGQYSGRRCFIIGTGPSLTVNDLDMLKNEYSFSCNSVFVLYPYTKWRPNFYFVTDTGYIEYLLKDKKKFQSDILDNCDLLFTGMPNPLFFQRDSFPNGKIVFLPSGSSNVSDVKFSAECDKVVYTAGTVVYKALQMAVYMGFSTIYLLGIDFSFSTEIKADNTFKDNDVTNHNPIIENYETELYGEVQKIFNRKYVAFTDWQLKGYQAARKYADTHGIKIYNATRGGKLEVFERVDFDSLF